MRLKCGNVGVRGSVVALSAVWDVNETENFFEPTSVVVHFTWHLGTLDIVVVRATV